MTTVTNHLWQSTLFAMLVAVASLALRRKQAKTRYGLWLAASAKFLIPFSLLVSLGAHIDAPISAPAMTALAVEQITTSFAPASLTPTPFHQGTPWWPKALVVAWLIGVVIVTLHWFRRWLVVRATLQGATPLPIAAPIPILSSRGTFEPGVFGLFRPRLLLPDGITSRLTPEELESILQELSHVQCRDNQTAALHMVVEILFWFHPLVWWIGAKLVERKSLDEAYRTPAPHLRPGHFERL